MNISSKFWNLCVKGDFIIGRRYQMEIKGRLEHAYIAKSKIYKLRVYNIVFFYGLNLERFDL